MATKKETSSVRLDKRVINQLKKVKKHHRETHQETIEMLIMEYNSNRK